MEAGPKGAGGVFFPQAGRPVPPLLRGRAGAAAVRAGAERAGCQPGRIPRLPPRAGCREGWLGPRAPRGGLARVATPGAHKSGGRKLPSPPLLAPGSAWSMHLMSICRFGSRSPNKWRFKGKKCAVAAGPRSVTAQDRRRVKSTLGARHVPGCRFASFLQHQPPAHASVFTRHRCHLLPAI